MNTRKYPRTMQEAFGPYTDNQIAEDESMETADKVVVIACAVAFVYCMALIYFYG
jgi:hypothetical protein